MEGAADCLKGQEALRRALARLNIGYDKIQQVKILDSSHGTE